MILYAHRRIEPQPILEPSTILPIGVKMVYIGHMENNTAIRDFFTETEWDAIFDAICEFQDHGEDEHLISHTIQMKIRELFA